MSIATDTPVSVQPVRRQSAFRKWLPLPIMGLAIIIVTLDTTLLSVALRPIVRDLDTDLRSIQWVITAYSLTLAALTVTGGRVADLLGRKRVFIAGAIVFAVGSLIASFARNVPELIVGEAVIEGMGAAMMMPASASLLFTRYEGKDRSLALGFWGGMAALGAAIGPVVGGYLTTNFSWRWGFRINVFVAAVLVLASVFIRDVGTREPDRRIDWLGSLLSAAGLLCGVFAIIEGSSFGWWRAIRSFHLLGITLPRGGVSVVPVAMALAVAFLFAFVRWEAHVTRMGRSPLVSLRLFRIEQFRDSMLVQAMISGGQVALVFGVPLFLQSVAGLDALHTGYALLPLMGALAVVAPLGGYLARRVAPKRILQTGLLITCLGLVLLHQALHVNAGVGTLSVPLVVYGIGVGLGMSQLVNFALSAVPARETGEAAGINSTTRQIGSSLGTAVIGTVVLVAVGSGLANGIRDHAHLDPGTREVVATAAKEQASEVQFGGPVRTSVQLTAAQRREIDAIAKDATVSATRLSVGCMGALTLLAFFFAARLPLRIDGERGARRKRGGLAGAS